MTSDKDSTGTDSTGDQDEIALPRFEKELRLRLSEAHRAQGTTTRHPHRRAARRSLWIGTGGIVAAAAAVVVVAVVAREPDSATDRPDVGATAEEPRIEDLATLIIAATEEAESTSVVYVAQDNTSYGDDQSWTDETTGSHRSQQTYENGEPSFDSSLDAESQERQVDYCFSEYTERPAGLPAVPGNATGWVQSMLERGELVEDGTEVVDGRELIRLVEVLAPAPPAGQVSEGEGPVGTPLPTVTAPDPNDEEAARIVIATAKALEEAKKAAEADAAAEADRAAAAASQGVPTTEAGAEAPEATISDEDEVLSITLVDPESYRPVKHIGYPGSDSEYVQTYEYLPRTPENLAFLTAPVPPGFTRVDQLRGDGERFDAGCV